MVEIASALKQYGHMAMSGAINLGHEPCTCAETAGAGWRLAKALSKEGQHGNVVRRGVILSVKGQCLGVMGRTARIEHGEPLWALAANSGMLGAVPPP